MNQNMVSLWIPTSNWMLLIYAEEQKKEETREGPLQQAPDFSGLFGQRTQAMSPGRILSSSSPLPLGQCYMTKTKRAATPTPQPCSAPTPEVPMGQAITSRHQQGHLNAWLSPEPCCWGWRRNSELLNDDRGSELKNNNNKCQRQQQNKRWGLLWEKTVPEECEKDK